MVFTKCDGYSKIIAGYEHGKVYVYNNVDNRLVSNPIETPRDFILLSPPLCSIDKSDDDRDIIVHGSEICQQML